MDRKKAGRLFITDGAAWPKARLAISVDFPYRVWFLRYLKKSANSLLSENQTRARFFQFFEQTTKPIFLKFFRYIELRGPGKKLLDVFRYV